MNSKDCFELLGVPADYNGDDFEQVIYSAFASKVTEYSEKKQNGEISVAEYYQMYDQLLEAKNTLINSKKNATPTPAPVSPTGAQEAKKTKSAGSGAFKKFLVATGVVAVIGGSIALGWFLNEQYDKNAALNSNVVGIETTIGENENKVDEHENETKPSETVSSTEATEENDKNPEETKEEVKPMVVNYGNISDEALVTERATTVANQLGEAGVINMNTGMPYTVDEVLKVSKFICGAYVPEVEAEAYSMVNDYLNFCLMDSELTIAFANVNGIDWDNIEDKAFYDALKNTDLPNLQRLQETTPKIMIVDNMLYGDVSVAAYNYLKMFESRYQEMIYSTDQELCDDIYLDLTYSLTRLRVNGEYTFTWNNEVYTVTMNDFSGRDKVNAGNILQYYVFMYQTAFSKIDKAQINEAGYSVYNGIDDPSQEAYTYTYVPGKVHGETVDDSEHLIGYHDKNISLDDSVNYADHKYLETTEFFNAACYNGLRLEDIALNDEGYVFLTGDQPGQNFSTINQINSINAALANYYAKGLDYYNQTFNKTLTK